ncbi:MAG: O-antigen ligase family protein, partial [Bacillota bacterium]|nr:O-antigen ligase family protein [Bacillota bacterium]
ASWVTGTNNYTYNRDWILIGLNGSFYSSNAQSIILIAVVPMFLAVVLSLKSHILFLAAVAASWLILFFNGTRAAYVGMMLGFAALLFAFICHRFVARSRQLVQVRMVTLLILVLAIGLSVFLYPQSVTAKMAGIKIDQLDRLDDLDQPVPTPDPQVTPTPTEPGTDPGKDDPDPIDPSVNAWRKSFIPTQNISPVIADAFAHFVMNATTEQLFDKRVFQRKFVAITMQYSNLSERLFGYGSSWYAQHVNDLESDYAAIYGYYGYFGVFMYFAPVLWLIVRLLASLRKKRFRDLMTVSVILPAANVVMLFGVAILAGRALLQPSVSLYLSLNLALLYLAVTEDSQVDEGQLTVPNYKRGI